MAGTLLRTDWQNTVKDELSKHAQGLYETAQRGLQIVQDVPRPDPNEVLQQLQSHVEQVAQPVQDVVQFGQQQAQQVQQQLQDYATGLTQMPQPITAGGAEPFVQREQDAAPIAGAQPAGGSLQDYARQAALRAGVDPEIFVRQIQQESGFNPRAGSPAGAQGIAQIMPQYHNVDTSDPYASLDYAANLMRSHLASYGGDYGKALAAYNAGPGAVAKYGGIPPFEETERYVKTILGGTSGQTAPTAQAGLERAGAAIGGANRDISQFGDAQLTNAEAYAACGPAAAVRFAQRVGRNPSLKEALDLAKEVGWTQQQGMAGIQSQQRLMERLGVPTKLVGADVQAMAREAQSGNPVTISTEGHYFYADGYDPASGAFHVGRSGTDLRGGKEWMTQAEMEARMGAVKGALFADSPLVPSQSAAVMGDQRPAARAPLYADSTDQQAASVGTPFQIVGDVVDRGRRAVQQVVADLQEQPTDQAVSPVPAPGFGYDPSNIRPVEPPPDLPRRQDVRDLNIPPQPTVFERAGEQIGRAVQELPESGLADQLLRSGRTRAEQAEYGVRQQEELERMLAQSRARQDQPITAGDIAGTAIEGAKSLLPFGPGPSAPGPAGVVQPQDVAETRERINQGIEHHPAFQDWPVPLAAGVGIMATQMLLDPMTYQSWGPLLRAGGKVGDVVTATTGKAWLGKLSASAVTNGLQNALYEAQRPDADPLEVGKQFALGAGLGSGLEFGVPALVKAGRAIMGNVDQLAPLLRARQPAEAEAGFAMGLPTGGAPEFRAPGVPISDTVSPVGGRPSRTGPLRDVSAGGVADVAFRMPGETQKDATLRNLRATGLAPADEVGEAVLGRGPVDSPEYLQGVVQFLAEQRQKILAGSLTPRDVIKAYLGTMSSVRGRALDQPTASARARGMGFEIQPEAVSSVGGQPKVRPEDAFAQWMLTPEGKVALDALERGDLTPAQTGNAIDRFRGKVEAGGMGLGQPMLKPEMLTGIPGPNQYNLTNIADLTARLNEAGRAGDIDGALRLAGQLKGVGTAKEGFVAHLLGMGDHPTVDSNELKIWLGRATPELREAVDRAFGTKGSPAAVEMRDQLMQRFDELRAQGYGTDLPPEAFQHVMHHWLFDRKLGAETRHDVLYRAQQRAQATPAFSLNVGGAAAGGYAGYAATPEDAPLEERLRNIGIGATAGLLGTRAITRRLRPQVAPARATEGFRAPGGPVAREAAEGVLQARAREPGPTPPRPPRGRAPRPTAEPGLTPRPPGAPEPERAGNILLPKFVNDDARQIIEEAWRANPTRFEEARRGVVSDEEVRELAETVGQNVGRITSLWKPGQAKNAETIHALRGALADRALVVQDTQALAQKAPHSLDARNAFITALAQHAAVQEVVSGITGEAGRALRVLREPIKGEQKALALLDRLAKANKTTPEEFAEVLLNKDLTNPEDVARAARAISDFTVRDKLESLWYFALLSNPMTHIKNTVSNALVLGTRPIESLAAGAIDLPRTALTPGGKRERFMGETPAILFGYGAAFPEGLREAYRTMRTGVTSAQLANPELASKAEPFSGRLADLTVNVPGRALQASDALFRNMHQQGSMYQLAYRQASQEGARGKDLIDRIAHLVGNPDKKMLQAATDEGAYRVFQQKGDFVNMAGMLREKVPALKFPLPFVQTPYNVGKYALERTPLALSKLATDPKGGGELSDRLARASVGTATMYFFYDKVAQGNITGEVPRDPTERDAFYRQGKQPYSIKVGDTWHSYQSLQPLTTLLGGVVAFHEAQEAAGEEGADIPLAMMTGGFAFGRALLDQPWLQGTQELIDLMSGADVRNPDDILDRVSQYMQRTATSPIPSIVRGLARAQDTTVRKPERGIAGIPQALAASIPGLQENAPAALTAFGEERQRPQGGVPSLFDPRNPSAATDDPLELELARLERLKYNVQPGLVGRRITAFKTPVELTEAEQRRYQRLTGAVSQQLLNAIVASPSYEALPDSQKVEVIEKVIENVRATVRQSMEPQMARRAVEEQVEQLQTRREAEQRERELAAVG